MVAVMVVEPAASAVAMPEGVMLATFAFASDQAAAAVTSTVEPSLYVAVALNCLVAPTETFAVAGDAATASSVFPGPLSPEEVPPHPTLASSSERVSEKNSEYTDL
jgi:hypothetical protein